jgi:aminoglycoside/choline kinase family phosphotransferase
VALSAAQAGSARRYFRLFGAENAVGCYGANTDENRAFITLANHFYNIGLPVPKIYAVSECGKYYLQQDLGDTSLFDVIKNGRASGDFSAAEKQALARTIETLAQFQFNGIRGLDTSACYPQPAFDKQTVIFDLNYFKYCFLKSNDEGYNEILLQRDFERLADWVAAEPRTCFLYRDFQSRNVMWRDEAPYFIDFQGGRHGAPYYDVASLLYQSSARLPDALREELTDVYLQAASAYPEFTAKDFRRKLPVYALLRILQTLGTYGFRGYVQHKPHFLKSIEPALQNIANLLPVLVGGQPDIPYLLQVLDNLCVTSLGGTTQNLHALSNVAGERLCINVISFSYMRGVPDDPTGNGGGFVFDCRNIENPGRQEEFKMFTGVDAPVSRYLDSNEQMQTFLQHIYNVIDTPVERYRARGFRNLLVCAGCTGGQHRSVYAAQRIAEHLHEQYPNVAVHLQHREQGIEKAYT